MSLQHHHHVCFGMDTPFLMPNSTWTSEINLFKSYNTPWSTVKPWIDQLSSTGVLHPVDGLLPVCSYDKQNLEYSGLFILGSLTPKFHSELEHAVGLDASGVEILIYIIECKLSLQVSLQRELISKLERLSLVNEPGENIPSFNIKGADLCEQIEKYGPAP